MYYTLLFFHSLTRWLVVLFLVCAICRSFWGYLKDLPFSATDNAIRHWTATLAHVQLMLGILLYSQSAIAQYFLQASFQNSEAGFYGFLHPLLMVSAIVLLTLGSALTKRKPAAREQFRTMLVWYSVAFIILLVAIPWSFSPWFHRPNFRMF